MEKMLEQYANGGNNVGNSETNNGSNSGSDNGGDTEPPQEPPVVDTTLSVGKTIYYDSNNDNQKEEWIVYSMTDENNFEIISANTMGYLTLGYNDPYLPASVGDLNGNGTSEEGIDKVIWSYNHAIETINNYCDEIVTATDNSGVRSIGATTSQDTAGDYKYMAGLKDSDTYGEEAITYLTSINCLTSKDSSNYWIASRKFAPAGAYVPSVYQVGLFGDIDNANYLENTDNLAQIIYIPLGKTLSELESTTSKSAGVRPIITNPVNYSFTNN